MPAPTEHNGLDGPYARRACCTTYHDQPHRPGCTFKERSRTYNADLRARLDAAGAAPIARATVDLDAIGATDRNPVPADGPTDGTAGNEHEHQDHEHEEADPVAGAYYENLPDADHGPVVEVIDPYGRTLATMHTDSTPADPTTLF